MEDLRTKHLKGKYRIVKRITNLGNESFHIQTRFLWFWYDVTLAKWSNEKGRLVTYTEYDSEQDATNVLINATEHSIKQTICK